MTTILKSQLVPYSTQQMFDLIDDVESYADFLPWCSCSEVISCEGDEMVARLELKKGRVKNSFTTRNYRENGEFIELNLVEGPFKELKGVWRFSKLDECACEVSIKLEYEYSNSMVKAVFGVIFNHASSTLVKAFVKRAGEIYD